MAGTIAEAMARKGYTQQRLAREAGVTAPWVNMILRRAKPPGPRALLRIADALGLDRRRLVRQAHAERAYDEWRPYLERADDAPAAAARIPVIGEASAGVPSEPGRGATGGTGSVAEAAPPAARDAGPARPDIPDDAGVGFHPDCRAVRVTGESLEPVAYDGQYVVISPLVRKEDIPDGAIVYVTFELPAPEEGRGTPGVRSMIKRVYRNRLAGESPGESGLPVYSFIPVNAHLRLKGRAPEPAEAVTLRHRQVREMYPVVGVIFEDTAPGTGRRAERRER